MARAGSGLDNDALDEMPGAADFAGIDAPFGWPRRFVRAVAQWSSDVSWPEPWDLEARPALRLRETYRWLVATLGGRAPLSVSADSIAVCAMRACTLLARRYGSSLHRPPRRTSSSERASSGDASTRATAKPHGVGRPHG